MKNTNQVFEQIENLSLMKPKEKEAALEILLSNELFEKVIVAALDPFITYGIKKFSTKGVKVDPTLEDFGVDIWSLLERLSKRQLTGHAAIEEVERAYNSLDDRSATLLERILKKDLRAGFSAKMVNKVKPNTIYVFTCMLSHKYEEKRIKSWPVHVEEKLDGVRVLAINDGNGYRFFSRTGKEFLNYQLIAETLNTTYNKDMVFDGEIVNKSGSFNETVGDAHKKGKQATEAVFHIFDMIPKHLFDQGRYKASQLRRKELLANEIQTMFTSGFVKLVEPVLANSHEEVISEYQKVRDKGGEGIIVKPLDGNYECKRSFSWLKIKDCQTADVVINGFEEGTGKNKSKLGALIVDFNGTDVSVGGGLTDLQRETIWDNKDQYINRLIEVEFHEVTPDGSLRHPRFIKMRDDKPFEDGAGV